MTTNTAKAKMLRGEPAFGLELGMGSPLVAEALAGSGIDYLQIDNQHGDWGPDSTIAALTAIAGSPATPMARVARNDYTMIGRNDPTYWDWIDQELFLAVQIESQTAVENAEAILSTPGVDGCWVGRSDMAFSMGIHPRDMLNDERHQRNLERVLDACRNTGTIPGFASSSPEDAKRRAERGFRFLTCGGDHTLLMTGAAETVSSLGLSAKAAEARPTTY